MPWGWGSRWLEEGLGCSKRETERGGGVTIGLPLSQRPLCQLPPPQSPSQAWQFRLGGAVPWRGSLPTTWVQALCRGQRGATAAAALGPSVLWVQIPAFGERGAAFTNRIGRRNCLPLGAAWWTLAALLVGGWEEAASTLGGEGAPRLLCPFSHPLLLTRSCLSPLGPTCLAPHGGSCSANPHQETLGHVGHQPWGRDSECCGPLLGVQAGSSGGPAQHRHSWGSRKGQPCQSWAMAPPAPKCPALSAGPPGAPLLPGASGGHLGAVMRLGTGTPC